MSSHDVKYVCINICISKCKCEQNACNKRAMYATAYKFMHTNCKQNENKLCACACKQMFTCDLHTLTSMQLGQILKYSYKEQFACKIRVSACIQHMKIFVRAITYCVIPKYTLIKHTLCPLY